MHPVAPMLVLAPITFMAAEGVAAPVPAESQEWSSNLPRRSLAKPISPRIVRLSSGEEVELRHLLFQQLHRDAEDKGMSGIEEWE